MPEFISTHTPKSAQAKNDGLNYRGDELFILTKKEFEDCRAAAPKLLNNALKDTINRTELSPFNEARLVSVKVSIIPAIVGGRGFIDYKDLDEFKANSSIELITPLANLPKATTSAPRPEKDLERVIYGALVHECTHIIQKLDAPITFSATGIALRPMDNDPKATCEDWHDFYYGLHFEFEAHAAQAAAEVQFLNGAVADYSAFETELTKTFVFGRIDKRMPQTTSSLDRITNWWSIWKASAWEIYQRIK